MLGPVRHLHGHNASVDIKLASKNLDERGMVMDFSDVKVVVKSGLMTT